VAAAGGNSVNQATVPSVPWQPCDSTNWQCIQVKHKFEVELGKMLQPEPKGAEDQEVPYLKAQHVQWKEVRLDDLPTMWAAPWEIEALRLSTGDLLVCEGGEVGRAAVLQNDPPPDCIIQNALHRVRGKNGGDVRFLSYLLRHATTYGWFDVLCNRATIAHFTADKFGEMRVWLPSYDTQMRLADFLDRETAGLDSLVAEKERLLELLAEKRRALITRAVTRGVDDLLWSAPAERSDDGALTENDTVNPTGTSRPAKAASQPPHSKKFRDSGLPWLGEIPVVDRLKFYLSKIEQGWSPQCENYPADEGEWGVLKVGAVNGWKFNPNENKRLPDDIEPLPEYEISSGDVLISRANTMELLGSTAIVREARPKLLLCDKLYRLVFNSVRLERDFLVLFLRSASGRYEFERDATGASNSMQNIGQGSVRNVWVPTPPVAEQHAIVAHIVKETAKLDALREATERTIGLLKERRAALIAAAVTGKIQVPVVSEVDSRPPSRV
jgi:type I restriction enzyme S subunit